MPRARATASSVQFLPEFGRAVSVAEYERPMMSDDVETAQTIAYMDELADADAGNRAVIDATHEALNEAGLTLDSDPEEIARAVFWWLKRTITYVPTPGTSPLVDQTLITPTAMLAMPNPIGDCPQFSMLAAAMFRVCCVPCYFVTIAAEPAFPDQFSHVYNTVEVGGGKFMPFDSSNGPEPGAEYAKAFKRRVWPRVMSDKCSSARKGSTPMMRTSYATRGVGYRSRSLRGTLRDVSCDADGDCIDTGSGASLPSGTGYGDGTVAGTVLAYNQPSNSDIVGPGQTNPYPVYAPVPPANVPGASSTGVLTTLLNDATSVAAPIVKAATQQAPYYITNAAGQSVLYNPNTGTTVTAASLLTSMSPTALLAVGVGLVALFAFSGRKQ